MDLKNWEMFAGTGGSVVGANVSLYAASDVNPNPGSVLASTTTDSNGMWVFTGLGTAIYDVKVDYSGRVKWYKGNTRHIIGHLYDDTTPDANRNLLHNGGQDSYVERGSGALSLVLADPGAPNTADGWVSYATAASGDSGTVQADLTTTAPNSKGATKVTYNRSTGQFNHYRDLPDILWQALKGQVISASAQVNMQTTSSELRVYIDDGVSVTTGTVTSTTGSWQTISATKTLSASATKVRVGVQTNRANTGSQVFWLDNIIADLTSVPPVYAMDANDAIILPLVVRSTIVPASPTVDSNTLAVLLNNLAARVRDIIGAAPNTWRDAIPVTLTGLLATVTSHTASIASLSSGKFDKTGGPISAAITVTGEVYVSNDGGDPAMTMRMDGNANNLAFVAEPTPSTGSSISLNTGPAGGSQSARLSVNPAGAVSVPVSLDATVLSRAGNAVVDAGNIASQSVANAANVTTNIAGVGIANYARVNRGTYAGSGGAHTVSVGFQASMVIINDLSNRLVFVCIGPGSSPLVITNGTTSIGLPAGVHIDVGTTFTVGATTAEANQAGSSYTWVAYS